ncbi:MAG TPA: MOSC domain-containing protein, partial [Steroidobacter sp.]|nr:MOSC domain-containing protein [Steroidobacter sp.]
MLAKSGLQIRRTACVLDPDPELGDPASMAQITALHIYPVKSCRGLALDRARITPTGFEHDREWMIVRPDGRFITQREEPRLALIEPTLMTDGLQLRAPGAEPLLTPYAAAHAELQVVCWRDACAAFDAGPHAARWLSELLGAP